MLWIDNDIIKLLGYSYISKQHIIMKWLVRMVLLINYLIYYCIVLHSRPSKLGRQSV